MRLTCHYCARDGKPDELAVVTVHDRRGCLHVCWKHANWRQTTSFMGGHSPDCQFHEGKEVPR